MTRQAPGWAGVDPRRAIQAPGFVVELMSFWRGGGFAFGLSGETAEEQKETPCADRDDNVYHVNRMSADHLNDEHDSPDCGKPNHEFLPLAWPLVFSWSN